MISRHNPLDEPGMSPRAPTEVLAAAWIGPEGGSVRVADPDSVLFGTTLRIPAGALECHTRIQIETGEHRCSFGFGPSVKITPEGVSFNSPAEMDMRVNSPWKFTDQMDASFYVYDRSTADWTVTRGELMYPTIGVFRCLIDRL